MPRQPRSLWPWAFVTLLAPIIMIGVAIFLFAKLDPVIAVGVVPIVTAVIGLVGFLSWALFIGPRFTRWRNQRQFRSERPRRRR